MTELPPRQRYRSATRFLKRRPDESGTAKPTAGRYHRRPHAPTGRRIRARLSRSYTRSRRSSIPAEMDISTYFQDYLTVGAFAGLGVVLVLVMLGVAAVLRPSNPTSAKVLTYECGV